MFSNLLTPWRRLRLILLLSLMMGGAALWSADSPWQTARIVDVKTTTDTRTTTWAVNAPIQDEETVCTVRIHLKDKIVQGTYRLGKSQAPPPPEWIKHMPVRVQFAGDTMFLKAPTGDDYKLHIVSAKPAAMMDPLTPEELAAQSAAARQEQEAPRSMIGFDEKTDTPAKQSEPTAQPAPPPPQQPVTGTVKISSMPYLAEVFVDGESMGYTPAQLNLPPGKHSFRCEKRGYKPWTKEITVTTNSELTLDATLSLARK
jgi:PEGA domain